MRRIWALLLLPALVMLDFTGANAQAGTDRNVIASGGVYTANTGYRIAGTLGQPIIGAAVTLHRTAYLGFWYPQSNTSALSPVPGDNSALLRCTPNPISRSATIAVNVAHRGNVTVTLHDLLGRTVLTLEDGVRDAGEFSVELDATELPEGRYTVRYTHEGDESSMPVLIVR